ncbi:MAG: hypothetical protein AAF518_01680 [Spirochaetota bacterium]
MDEKEPFLFNNSDTKTIKARADFTNSYTAMTSQVKRVSYPEYSRYDILCAWMYRTIHKKNLHIDEQNLRQIVKSIRGLKRIIFLLKPLPDDIFQPDELTQFIHKNF